MKLGESIRCLNSWAANFQRKTREMCLPGELWQLLSCVYCHQTPSSSAPALLCVPQPDSQCHTLSGKEIEQFVSREAVRVRSSVYTREWIDRTDYQGWFSVFHFEKCSVFVCLSVCLIVCKFSHFSLFHPPLFIQYSTEECSTVQLFIYKNKRQPTLRARSNRRPYTVLYCTLLYCTV